MTPNPQPAAEPLPAQGTVPANLMADLFPGSGEPLPPSTQTPPSSDVFGIDISPAPVMPSAAAAPEVSAVSGLSLEDFVSKHIADPDTLFQGDGRKISQFRELRGLFEGATRDLAAAHLELSQLRQSQVAAPVSNGAPLPETEAIQKLTAEVEALKPAAQRWQEQEARQSIRQTPAFRAEFDAPRAEILREIGEVSDEIGLDREDVEEFLRLDTELKQSKWIRENVDDSDAADIYRQKGKAFLSMTKQATAVLESADPIAALRDWEDYNSAFATKFAAKLEESAAKELQGATSRVLGQLSAGADPFFATDSGKAVLSDLTRRAAEGRGFSADEVVEAVAMSRSAAAYQALAQNLQHRALAAERELARLRGLNPTPIPPDPLRGGAAPAPGDLYGFGSHDGSGIRPLILADQIRLSS
jgi:hypothetical protein